MSARDADNCRTSLRRDGFNVIGSSAYGARLENDRAYAQRILGELGLSTATSLRVFRADEGDAVHRSASCALCFEIQRADAATFVGRHRAGTRCAGAARGRWQDRRLEFRPDGFRRRGGDGRRRLFQWRAISSSRPASIGSTSASFPAISASSPAKWARSSPIRATSASSIARSPRWRRCCENGYCGYINLNTIVNEEGIWPLEFTCRFGYPGYAILDPLQETSWADLFRSMLTARRLSFDTESGLCGRHRHYDAAVSLLPRRCPGPVGLPVLFDGDLSPDELRHLHYGEVGLQNGVLVTSGASGYTLVVTGMGQTIEAARDAANVLANKVIVANARYRRDIGERLIEGEFAKVEALGLLDP